MTHFLGQKVSYTGSRNMADIQLLQSKNQQKTSSSRRKIVLCKEMGLKEIRESNAGVRIFTGSS